MPVVCLPVLFRTPLSSLLARAAILVGCRFYLRVCQYELTNIDWMHSSGFVLTGLFFHVVYRPASVCRCLAYSFLRFQNADNFTHTCNKLKVYFFP